ncbi:MAG: ferrochelatase [Chloroflexia bacterium]
MFVQHLNISIALIVFMGLASGGMLALMLMTTRKYQLSFSIVLLLVVALAVAGVLTSVSFIENFSQGLANAVVLLVLSFALGYALTTFSVLSYSTKRKGPATRAGRPDLTAVIQLTQGEPPDYGVESASRRLALADDPQDVPPVLFRPFYLRDLRSKYARIGSSPYREYHNELARKVQSRLDNTHKVYSAFYSDKPSFASALSDAIESGARKVVVVHVRITDPPDPVKAGELFEGLNPASYGVQLQELGPMWDSDLLPQIYVRRVLEAAPQLDSDPANIGLLLIGRGHEVPHGKARQSSSTRYRQEADFQARLRRALLKVGFDESRVVACWLRAHGPTSTEALQSLAAAGARSVLWMPSTFPADGINTLWDIPAQLDPVAAKLGLKLSSLGAWNADDLTAEDIAARLRQVPAAIPSPALS